MSENDVVQAQSRFQNDVVRGSLQVPYTRGNHLVDIFNHFTLKVAGETGSNETAIDIPTVSFL